LGAGAFIWGVVYDLCQAREWGGRDEEIKRLSEN